MPNMPATPLESALQAIDTSVCDPLIAVRVRGLMCGYNARWNPADYKTIATEEMLTARIPNATREGKRMSYSAKLTMAGKLDVIAERDGRRVLVDHKTTSQDIEDPNSPFWRQLAIENQVSHYLLLAWIGGQKFDECVWDVIRKPQTRPKKLSKTGRGIAVANQFYCGRRLSEQTLKELQTTETETLEMYEARLSLDCTVERPDHYFQRRTVPRLDHEIMEYAKELWQHTQDILHERKNTLPVRNPGACMLYGTPCKFLGICSGHDEPDSDRWTKKQNVHTELPDLDGDGHDVLTNSRIRSFQTCRRKHYYEYELGIERVDAEDKEALVFGSVFHDALEAFWSSNVKEKDYGDGSTDLSANAVGSPAADGTEANVD